MGKLFVKLKRRKVLRVGTVYTVVAWLLIHFSKTVLRAFDASNWQLSGLVISNLLYSCPRVG